MDIIQRQEIFQVYKNLPPKDLQGLMIKSREHLEEINLTYRGSESHEESQTHLDPLPFVMKTEDISFLKNAVNQWGRLLTSVYQDLWGNQDLLTRKVLDQGLIWGDLAFDPANCDLLPRDCQPLNLIRLDLKQSESGFWSLNSLGTGVPRGLGFTIENRIVHGRYFGSKMPRDNLVRLAPFFQNLKDLWFNASLTHKDEPSIMVWTDGPSDPHYFEPVYLSRYFGYPLVESRDLTVRSGKVFLKTLGGLRPVDVLVRMLGDASLDPLSGNPGNFAGVAGLMQAVRDGTVLVTNAPGAGLLEHPSLLPHYPKICRHILDEELLLFPASSGESAPLKPGKEDFFEKEAWESASVGVRIFAARFPGGWELMPGGLVQRLEGSQFLQNNFNGTKKDLWFLASEVVPHITLLPVGEKPSEINRAADLPSRVADDLFWLGRYTERAWVDLRFMEKWWEFHFEGGPENQKSGTGIIDSLVAGLGILPEGEGEHQVWIKSRLFETLGEINRVAGQVLDRLSLETHRILRELGSILKDSRDLPLPEILRQVNLRLAAFSGLTMESMTRSSGWRFLDMGRRLERAQLVIESLQNFFSLESGEENLNVLLDIFDSTLTYRTRYRLSPQRGPVLDLLLLDESNPRSLAFQIENLNRHVEHLPRGSQRSYQSMEERISLSLMTKIRLCDGVTLIPGVLEQFLEELMEDLERLSAGLHQAYLAKIDPMEALQSRGKIDSP